MRRFRFKLVGYFVRVLLLALLLSSALMVLMCAGYVDGELLTHQRSLSNTALELNARTQYTPAEIAQALSSSDYVLSVVDIHALDDDARIALLNGQTAIRGFFLKKTLYFRLGESAMSVEANLASSLLVSALLRSFLGNLILILIGFLIVYALSRRIAQPIVNLMEATQQVAQGNFNISVDTQMPRFAGGIREVAQLADNFNRMAHALQSVEYLQRDFTDNLSHELKTPIASIRGYARLLECEGVTDEERHEYIRTIASESARLSTLSDNLLKLTRLERHPALLSGEKFNLDEQLRRAVTALLPAIEKKRQTIDVDLPRVSIEGDETLLGQVWTNLIDNAIKFTPEGGHIEVALTHAHGQARVCIADDGIGIDEAAHERIFERFYQADLSHSAHGNGLGLALARRIVDICRGRIELTSSPGKGARFTVILPERHG